MRNTLPTNKEKVNITEYINNIMKYQRKSNFATKLTGPPRISFLSNIFQDGYFINIIRDPRAVVASLLNVGFRKRKGFDNPFWQSTFTNDLYKEWEQYNKSPVSLLALEWRTIYEQTKLEVEKYNCKILNIRYEDYIDEACKILKKVMDFVGLNYCNKVFKFANRTNYKNMNYKYKERLSDDQIAIVEDICRNEMNELGYRSYF